MAEVPRFTTLIRIASVLEVPVGHFLVAAGWFDDGHFASISPSGEAVEQDTLATVLSEIEAELATILELERQAKSRSDRLRSLIQGLKATSACSVTMSDHEDGA